MSSPSYLPVLLIVTPLLFAVLCPVIGVRRERYCFPVAIMGSAMTCVVAWILAACGRESSAVTYNLGGWFPPWGIQLRIDLPGTVAVCAVATAIVLLILYSRKEDPGCAAPGRLTSLYTLMMLVEAGTLGFIISGDLFNMFLFMEIFFFAACGLTTLTMENRALKASFRYLMFGALSSSCFLLAIGLLYGITGTMDMGKASLKLSLLEPGYAPVAATALFLFLLALAVQSAVFPFQRWLEEAALNSQKTVRAVLCVLVILVPAFGMLRLLGNVYGALIMDTSSLWKAAQWAVAWLGAVSLVFFSVKAAMQKTLPGLVISSSLSQVGLLVLSMGLALRRIPVNFTYCLVAALCGGGCLLLTAGIFELNGGLLRLKELRGAGKTMPLAAAALILGSLTVIGVPFTVGYTAKKSIIETCINSGQWWFTAIVIFASVMQLFYCLRISVILLSKPGAKEGRFDKTPPAMLITGLAAPLASTTVWALSYALTPALLASFKTMIR